MERYTGIEPVSQPWEGRILPLNQYRVTAAVLVVCARRLYGCEFYRILENRQQLFGSNQVAENTASVVGRRIVSSR